VQFSRKATVQAVALKLPISTMASAQLPVVRAILFFSPTCPHCHEVTQNDLPPLMENYGPQLENSNVDVTTSLGQQLYQDEVAHFQIPQKGA